MPRFTIGSLLTGTVLFVLALGLWTALNERRAQAVAAAAATSTSAGGVHAAAIDPSRLAVVTGPEAVNDYGLEDAYEWSGGLDASTW
jgi:hypothetical protein